ncbi:MAG TPA: alkaline phosphatase D family protein [Chitinophagales bacterium]|nr:alkaline phosphatase D family protein [Chitinophagales bacterium]
MRFCFALLAGLFTSVLCAQSQFDSLLTPLLDPAMKPFYFGVASGDPHQTTVIIWTKVWNENGKPVKVKWQVATDTTMQHIVAEDEVTSTAGSAYTVKVNVKGLQAGTIYFYRFSTGGVYSPIGRTKTAPEGDAESLRFAVVSCNNYIGGYFNAYRLIANRNDIDAVIHLGDYIYEYGASAKKKKSVVRVHIPGHEIITLQDYRSRYAQYRLDKDMQEVHRLHPFITEWDDHEFANNTYKEGAGNHQLDKDGDWEERKGIARKVYFEWLPITDNDKSSIIRKMNYGGLAEVFMLDGRVEGRCKQLDSPQDTLLSCETRTMLGKEQSDWLTEGMKTSTARWKVMANQVVFSEMDAHQLTKKYAINADAWDGYPVERKAILDSFYHYNIKNIIVITGDIHLSWGFDLVQNPKNKERYNRQTGKGVIGAELVTPSISSNGLGERFPRGLCNMIGSIIKRKATNPHLRFQNLVDHGYVLLDLNKDRAQATWNFCKTVKKPSTRFKAKDTWMTKYNDNKLVKVIAPKNK